MGLSTHVLDVAAGRPAAGVTLLLEAADGGGGWHRLAEATTDADGRVPALLADEALEQRTYRLTFDTGAYFGARGQAAFWPRVVIEFAVREPAEHHHVPLLVSPHGYTTYRGS